MRKLQILLLLLIVASPVHALSLKQILQGSTTEALRLYTRHVMPVDGWAKVEKGKALVVRGEAFWNPDYVIIFKGGTVKFTGPIPTGVDVAVDVYKVYFGVIALHEGEYRDIWWSRKRIGDGWTGSFFVSGFKWRWLGGESEVSRAYIAYNSPSIGDLSQNISREISLEIIDWESLNKKKVGSSFIILGGLE